MCSPSSTRVYMAVQAFPEVEPQILHVRYAFQSVTGRSPRPVTTE